jgi:hypothetical protein
MCSRSRLASVLALCVLTGGASACGNSPTAPGATGRVAIVATLAPGAGDAAVGAISSLRVEIRDASGVVIGSPLVLSVAPTDSTFRIDVKAATGEGRTITVLATGDRPVSGAPDGFGGGTGVLYRGSIAGVNVSRGTNTSVSLALTSFVPTFEPLEAVPSGARIRWHAESGAQAYSLIRFYDGVGFTSTPVWGTSFVDDTGASRYQVVAIETSGRRSAPSDVVAGL